MRRKTIWKLIAFIVAWLILLSGCSGEMPDLGAVFMSTPTATPPNTPIPSPTATLVPDLDFDQDGLSNISELVKYGTNPYEQDSDNDGVPDGDWDERREYRYSVRVIMKIRQPFDLEAMNDDMFQDARIVEQEDAEGYTTLEILLFPITGIPLTPSAYPPTDLPQEVQAYTLPGLTTNTSQAMQEEVDHIVRHATNDVHAVYEILEWTSRNVRTDRNRHARALVFYYTYEVDEAVYLRNLWPGVSGNVMQGTYLYADSMYWNTTTGDSCSYSTLVCSMLRAAGLPCRIMQTLDPIYSHVGQSEEYDFALDRFLNDGGLSGRRLGARRRNNQLLSRAEVLRCVSDERGHPEHQDPIRGGLDGGQLLQNVPDELDHGASLLYFADRRSRSCALKPISDGQQ